MRFTLIIALTVFFLGCSHRDHSKEESTGLAKLIEASERDTINISFEHQLQLDREISFIAPFAVANIKNTEGGNTPILVNFSIDGEDASAFFSKVKLKQANGATPVSLSLVVTSEVTYGSVLEKAKSGKAELPGFCDINIGFSAGPTESSGKLLCKIFVSEIPSELLPVPETDLALWHVNIFNCHSHWGFSATSCHCKNAKCCPSAKCACDPGPAKSSNCSNNVTCQCE